MVQNNIKLGWKNFVISSSGNAAIASTMFTLEYNKKNKAKQISLIILIGKNIETNKLKILKNLAKKDKKIEIKKSTNPKQESFLMEKNKLAKNLRQSIDELAAKAYIPLAQELSKIKNLSSVFVPTSSGTTAQGLYLGFKKLKLKPQIHIVQTEFCHPFIEDATIKTRHSLAKAIVDKTGFRKPQIKILLKKTKGRGWVVNNREIKNAINLAKKIEKINISPNSALSLAALIKAKKQGAEWTGPVACLITGP